MFKQLLSSSSLKLCAAAVCSSLVLKNWSSSSDFNIFASGYNYSRRFFPAASEYPDISKNRNIMARNLNKAMYARMRDLRTSNGFTIDDAIQTGKKTF